MSHSNHLQHIAIIMDGNGRWATRRSLPRVAGHKAGVESVRKVISACRDHQIKYLTLFAFSSENWQRPVQEVKYLLELLLMCLQKEINSLDENNVKIQFIGDYSRFEPKLNEWIFKTEKQTKDNNGLVLTIAINYGGRWEIAQAAKKISEKVIAGEFDIDKINEQAITDHLQLPLLPEPDLLIRTSGEQRISNFLIWQLAYTEIYFTESLWPDFDEADFSKALEFYHSRERRFGRILET